MSAISPLGTSTTAAFESPSLSRGQELPSVANSPSSTETEDNAAASSTVRISDTGRALSLQNQAAGASDGAADTTDAARKTLLKQIEQLREQIEQRQQALAKLMTNETLSREQKEAQVNAAQSEIRSLQAALTAAQGMLLQIEQQKLQNGSL